MSLLGDVSGLDPRLLKEVGDLASRDRLEERGCDRPRIGFEEQGCDR